MKAIRNSVVLLGLYSLVTACGGPSERKENMLKQSDRMDDSLQTLIDSSLNAPLKELSMAKGALLTTTYVFEYK